MSWIDKIPPLTRASLVREISRVTGIDHPASAFPELKECDLRGAIGHEFNAPFISVSPDLVDLELLERFDATQLVTQQFMPLFLDDGYVFCATSCPWNVFLRDACQNVLGHVEVFVFQVSEREVLSLFERLKLAKTDYSLKAHDMSPEGESSGNRLSLSPEESSAWGVLSQLFIECLAKRATDIHIHPEGSRIRIRATINGSLQDLRSLPASMAGTVEHVLYNQTQTMFGQNRMKPQDGHLSFEFPPHSGRKVDLRLASLPMFNPAGEVACHITIRVQDSQRNESITLGSLGFPANIRQQIEGAIEAPGSLCIVAGPTGSGKTTTLAACLKHLNTPDRCIYAVEDPVENVIDGVAHVLVKNEVTFAAVIRSLLRKAPHVIMVGEIRDRETARMAMEAALTGHTVLTTVHADYCTEIPKRLTYVGIEPWQISGKLQLCSSQRLIKILCPHCSVETTCSAEMIQSCHYPTDWEGGRLRVASDLGCDRCGHTGYHDRQALIEVLPMNDHLEDMIIRSASSRDLRRYAVEALQMKPLRELALEAIASGITDYWGVERVIDLRGQKS